MDESTLDKFYSVGLGSVRNDRPIYRDFNPYTGQWFFTSASPIHPNAQKVEFEKLLHELHKSITSPVSTINERIEKWYDLKKFIQSTPPYLSQEKRGD